MTQITATQFEVHLPSCPSGVAEAHEPAVVTFPQGKGNIVLVSEQAFEGWQKAVHLLGNHSTPRA